VIDQQKARVLAREGFDLWQTGDLSAAAEKYALANKLADPDHWARHAYHGEYACVLEKLGRVEEAIEQSRLAVMSALDQGGYADQVAQSECCFYVELLIKNDRALLAIETLRPFLEEGAAQSWHLYLVTSRAFLALNDGDSAKTFALRCLDAAPTTKKREELASVLADSLGKVTP
jgi:tetratricopeptide (TPR) repeat protein